MGGEGGGVKGGRGRRDGWGEREEEWMGEREEGWNGRGKGEGKGRREQGEAHLTHHHHPLFGEIDRLLRGWGGERKGWCHQAEGKWQAVV